MNILFLTDNYPPETNAPASRTYEHAKTWVDLGHSVTVITCAPNYPAGKVFEGYKNKWYQKSAQEGITVVRVKTFITANEGFLKRTLDFVSFMVSGTIAACFQKKPDLIIATSPQFFCAVAGYITSVIKRTPWVFELRDIWPASIAAVGAMSKGRTILLLEKLELFLYRKADLIISVTNSFKTELVERGIDAEKIRVVTNGVDLEKFQSQEKDHALIQSMGLSDRFIVGYIGTHGMAHALPQVIESARLIEQSGLPIVFMFVGAGAEKATIESIVSDQNIGNVFLVGSQPKELMPNYWSICDLALIPLKNHSVFSSVIPSKLFECMAMQIPVVMSLPDGEATDIVKATGCGILVEPENPLSMMEGIVSLYNDSQQYALVKKEAGLSAIKYSRNNLAANMLSHLEDCVLKNI